MTDVPAWVVFPGSEWLTLTPAAAGFLQPDFDITVNSYTPSPLSFWGDVRRPDEFAAVLTRGGYMVKRWGRTQDYVYQTASLGKAFARAALGLAVYKLGLNPDQPVYQTWSGVGELSHPHKHMDNPTQAAITWRDLVDHTAGFAIESAFDWRRSQPGDWRGAKWTGNPTWDMYSFRERGQRYYSSANFVRLGQALTALWGIDLKTLLDNEIFSKLNVPAERWSWMSLREAYQSYKLYPEHPGYGHYADAPHEINGVVVRGAPGWVRMSAEDLARFGLLVATGGIWKGERLLTSEWLISKSGGNGSSVFGDSATYVAGSRVTAANLPEFVWVPDFQAYSFPQYLINPAVVPGKGVQQNVFGINQATRGLYRAHWGGNGWVKSTVDANANLTHLSAAFDPVTGSPQVYGIRANDKALYEAYWDGSEWRFGVLRADANLDGLSAIFDGDSKMRQVFGIRADTRRLYQAYRDASGWNFRELDATANLAALSALYDPGSRFPQVFGIRVGTGELYQANYGPGGWSSRTLDPGANLSSVSAVFDPESSAPFVFGVKVGGGALYQAYWAGGWNKRVIDTQANLLRLSAASGTAPGSAHVFGIQANSGKLYHAYQNGASWLPEVLDGEVNLTDVSAVFDIGTGKPQVFGIVSGTGALYRGYWEGTLWKSETLDGGANLSDVDATFGALVS